MRGGWTYIMANRPFGMTYVGVTANLSARVWQHRHDEGSAYCRKYGIKTLVLAEHHEDVETAIRREKALKAWRTEWKHRLIAQSNPVWRDLFDDIV